MTLSLAQWETILQEATPATYGEIVDVLTEKDLLNDDPAALVDAALDDGVLVEDGEGMFPELALTDVDDQDAVASTEITPESANSSPESGKDIAEAGSSGYDDVDWTAVATDVDPAGVCEFNAWMPAQDKKPWNPGASTENPRSWSNPDNWTTAEKTREWYEMHPQINGRAFILQGSDPEQNYNGQPDPFLFVDYDDVVDEDDGRPSEAAREVMNALGLTYTDFSSSWTGTHQIFRGSLPEGVRTIQFELDDGGEVEIYDQRRVCIMTGRHVQDTPVEPQPVDEDALEELADEHGQQTSTVSREDWTPDYDQEALAGMDEADDLQAIFDAIQHVTPRDIRLQSDLTEERPDGTLSFDPTWANSTSGKRLGWSPDIGWIYRDGDRGLDALQVVALEDGIITSVQDYPRGEDWWQAVDALRDRGAHIPTISDDAIQDAGRDDAHPLLEAAWTHGDDVDAEPASTLPLGQLEALPQADRRRAARKRGLDWPTTEEARDRLRETIHEAMRHEDETVVDAPTSLGKSYTIASERWGVWDDVTGGQRVVHLSQTRDSRDEAAAAARENDVDHFVLLGRHEACPIAAGDHDPRQAHDDPDKDAITVDGEPASQWLTMMCEGRGIPFSVAHTRIEHRKDQNGPLPCCQSTPTTYDDETGEFDEGDSGTCRAIEQWEDLRDSEASLIIATHNFAHVPSLRMQGNIVIDEEPDYDAGLGDSLEERKSRIERAVSAYLQEIDAVVQTWEAFITLARHDDYRGDAANERDALQDDLNADPDPDWYFEDPDAHTLAPALARAIFHAEPRANDRRVGKTVHEPPRLDANAVDDDGWNREWLTVVLDDQNQIRKVRNVPDFSQARSVVGLDAHPSVPVWSANTVPHINTTRVLDPEERRLWRRYERGLRVVQVGDATRPLASGEYWQDDQVRTLIQHLRSEYGDDFQTGITTSACETQLQDALEDAGVTVDQTQPDGSTVTRTMHYGEEKSRNDFAQEPVGLVEGCIDPGDDYVLDLLAELDLNATPETSVDDEGVEHREHGRGFDGPDADKAAEILASVRENHTAQAAGRYARDPDDPESHATVFVRTDAMPTDFADIHVPGIEWTFTQTQREIVTELREATGRQSTRELADAVGCTKEHVRTTLQRLTDLDVVHAYEGAGPHGATLYADSGLPNAGVADLGTTANDGVWESYTWSLAIREPSPAGAPPSAGAEGAGGGERQVWDWRDPSD